MKLTEHSVEDWAKKVESSKMEPLSKEGAEKMMMIALNVKAIDEDKDLMEMLEKKDSPYLIAVLWKRIKAVHTYTITPSAIVFLEGAIHSFGESTMMANYLQYIAYKTKSPKITLEHLCMFAFPMGFPSRETWTSLWQEQKLDREELDALGSGFHPDNMLDYPACMGSIKEIG